MNGSGLVQNTLYLVWLQIPASCKYLNFFWWRHIMHTQLSAGSSFNSHLLQAGRDCPLSCAYVPNDLVILAFKNRTTVVSLVLNHFAALSYGDTTHITQLCRKFAFDFRHDLIGSEVNSFAVKYICEIHISINNISEIMPQQ